MLVRYRGVARPAGSPRVGGCSACGQSRLGSTPMALMNPYTYYHEGREYNFYVGQEQQVPQELGEVLLRKYSYVNGSRLDAFEVIE